MCQVLCKLSELTVELIVEDFRRPTTFIHVDRANVQTIGDFNRVHIQRRRRVGGGIDDRFRFMDRRVWGRKQCNHEAQDPNQKQDRDAALRPRLWTELRCVCPGTLRIRIAAAIFPLFCHRSNSNEWPGLVVKIPILD